MSKNTTDPFAAYLMPAGLTDGVEIQLPRTPAVFTVRLPSSMNEDFQIALMADMNISLHRDESGEAKADFKLNPMEFQRRQRDLFFRTCILKAEGLPEGLTPADFFAAYPLAAKTIYDTASELAAEADKQIDAALGKSVPSQAGKPSGAAGSINTTH